MTTSEADITANAALRPGQVPAFDGDLARDLVRLRALTRAVEDVLSRLPARPKRAAAERRVANEAIGGRRRALSAFLRLHAERVYAELTGDLRDWLRLLDLVHAATAAFPGLLPAPERLAADAALPQAGKEGWEVEHGIFFHELLRLPEVGRHLLTAMLRPTPRARSLAAQFESTGSLQLATVRLERLGETAHVTMCNGRYLNAEDNQLVDDLETAVDLALLDSQVKVGVLRGGTMTHPRYEGRRVFCAGINLVDLHQGRISFVEFILRRELGYLHKIIRGLRVDDGWPRSFVEKPWIAAVDTFAIGGGMQMLFAVDHVVAAADAFVSLPAAAEGIVPGMANLRLTSLAGARLTRQVILSGRRLWARDPAAAAIIDEVTDPADLDAVVEAAAARLSSPAVVANRHMINFVEEPVDRLRAYAAEFALEQALRFYSEDVIAKVGRFSAGSSRAARPGGAP